jgi:D-alanyl-D-alanine carboxypeptidase/D-alanyl-D-alanine-endopeptidase (penicillin-binding protein 4)
VRRALRLAAAAALSAALVLAVAGPASTPGSVAAGVDHDPGTLIRATHGQPSADEATGVGGRRWNPGHPVPVVPWTARIDRLVASLPVSVSVGLDGRFLYRHRDTVRRPPASNEKLLLSMALLDELGPRFRVPMFAAVEVAPRAGIVEGDLWILGRGDPEIGVAQMDALAERIEEAGVRAVRGSVVGSTGFFRHDWWAPGWQSFHPGRYIALPTALTFEANGAAPTVEPERRAAEALTRELEDRGVSVDGSPGAGRPPRGLDNIASVRSAPLAELLARQNVGSINFHAEVLGKLLGARVFGPPGTIAKGAAAIEAWADEHGVRIEVHDGSGLSYTSRVGAAGLVRLLWGAEEEPWGDVLRQTLPRAGEGTLRGRLEGVRVRA